jgi:hypothetical protein
MQCPGSHFTEIKFMFLGNGALFTAVHQQRVTETDRNKSKCNHSDANKELNV